MKLLLIGYRGTGKTSVGQHLARLSGWPCVDTDAEIERASKCSIREIFTSQGEDAFRDLETEAIRRVAERDEVIVALGGGAVLRDRNRELLAHDSRAVWLRASVETIRKRLGRDPKSADSRPGLTAQGALDEVAAVLLARTPLYREFADFEVDTDQRTPAEIADLVWTWFQTGKP